MGAIDHWKIKVSQLTTNLDTTVCTAVAVVAAGGAHQEDLEDEYSEHAGALF